jgi:hypothetical protein
MEYEKLINKMSCLKIRELYYNCKMDIYTITHCKYDYSQPCLTLLTSCISITCDNITLQLR